MSSVFLNCSPSHVVTQVLHLGLSTPAALLFPLPSTGLQVCVAVSGFLHAARDPNLGLCVYAASTTTQNYLSKALDLKQNSPPPKKSNNNKHQQSNSTIFYLMLTPLLRQGLTWLAWNSQRSACLFC